MAGARLAAIDVGTNSIRCIVAESDAQGGLRILDDERGAVRLGEGLAASGAISPAAWGRARDTLTRMRRIAEGLGAEEIVAIATSAVRKASNGADFIAAMERDTGVKLRVISGIEEAELALLSTRHRFDLGQAPQVLADLGGGSLELVFVAGELIDQVVSLELGAVFLSETFLHHDPPTRGELQALRNHIRTVLQQALAGDQPLRATTLIGSGGGTSTIAEMLMARRGEAFDTLCGYEVLRADIVHLLAMLERMSARERRTVPGLSPERADIIVAGVTAIDTVMELLDLNLLRINPAGIREGLLLRHFQQRGALAAPRPHDWREGVERLARACHADAPHGRQVARLALALFDALAAEAGFTPRERVLVEAAALLHDIGYFISYDKHHKHSYHLIRYAELFDFSPREKEIVANLARYHRKSLPKKKHDGFANIGDAERGRVMQLAALVRLADGLDRRRIQAVGEIDCRRTGNQLTVLVAPADPAAEVTVEIHGGSGKSDLLGKAFGWEVRVAEKS